MTALRTKARGTGVSFRLPILLAVGMVMAMAFIAMPPSAHATCPAFELPPLSLQATNPARFRATDGAPASYYQINLTNIPAGYSVANGNYFAWCIDYFAPLPIETFLSAILRDSTGPLPSQLQSTNWDMVNYILNHKQGGAFDVQGAIWHFIGGPVPISDPAFFPQSVATLLMIQDAMDHGDGYLPTGAGAVVAVVVDAGPAIQLLILEAPAPFSRPPIANPDGFNTLKNTPLSTNASAFLANDYSPNATPLHLIDVSSNSTHGGTVTLSGLTVTYTPPTGFTGLDTFTYVLSDGVCDTASTTVTISVAPRVNQNPIANADTVTTPRDQPLAIPGVFLTANDSDPDGDPLVIVAISTNSAHGGLVMLVGTNVVYTPAAGFVGVDTFTYTIDDGFGGTATATVTVTVIRPNATPTPMNDTVSTKRDQLLNIPAAQLLANDTDPDGDTLVILSVSTNSAHGAIVVLIGTNVVYTPPPGFIGIDTFTYTVSDGAGGTATATVTVTVIRPNAAPTPMNDTASTMRDQLLNIPAAQLLANDTDPDGDPLVILRVSTNSAHGAIVVLIGTNVVYTPPPGFIGIDTFTYTVSDGAGGTATATVTVTVIRPNAAPTPMNDIASTMRDQLLNIPAAQLLANDTDPDGDPLVILRVSTNSAHGAIVVLIGTNVVYTPPPGFIGIDTFTYTVSDGAGGTATATVTVTVTRPNAAPTPMNDTASTMRDQLLNIPAAQLLANDTDPDGDPLVILGVSTNSAHGAIVVLIGTNVVYTPPPGFVGIDTFTYTVSDGAGGTATATVTVTVIRPNAAPTPMNDTASTMRDQLLNIPAGQLLANDTDPDGDLLTIITVSSISTQGGIVVLNGTNVVYMPPAGFVGTDTFTYSVSDGSGLTATATVAVTVIRPNAAPTPMNDVASALRDQPLNIPVAQLLANDTDPDGDPLVILGVSTNSAHGGIVVLIGTNVVYTPPPGFVGIDTFTYTVSDGAGGTATATVTVTVIRPNTAPVAMNDAATTKRNVTLELPIATLLANDSDADNDMLTLLTVDLSTAQHGAVMLEGTNVVYFPPLNFVGADMFSYSIGDGHGGTATAVVTVNVTRPNAAPVAMNDTATTERNVTLTLAIATLLANDSDADNDPLTLLTLDLSTAQHGAVMLEGTNVVYFPPLNFVGADMFSYSIGDGHGGTATAVVTVNVTRPNAAPAPMNDNVAVLQDHPLVIPVAQLLANDSDVDGDTLTIIGVSTNSAHGGIVVLIGTNVVYTPPAGFVGVDTFTYTVSDGQGGTATATVTVTVTRANTNPMAANDSASTTQNVALQLSVATLLANDTDADGDALTVIAIDMVSAQLGSTLLSGTNITYVPPLNFLGQDSFRYTISDGHGGTSTGTVQIAVNPVNHPPMAGNFAFTTLRDTPINLGLLFLLALASDPDGDMIHFDHAVPVSQAGGHTLLSLLTNGLLRYTPPAAFTGSDSFNYVVNDGRGLTATGTVTITVLDSPMGMIEEAAIYNPQTGLFEQRVTISNESSNTIPGLRIFISNLRTNIRVWNAAGVLNGTNYVQYNSPLNPGQSATFRVEYYVPDRRPFTPVLRSEEAMPVPQPLAQGGTGVAIDHSYLDTRLPGEPRLIIEFTSTPGRIYTIIYSDDMKSWKAATPSVLATANRTQWYDDGPPKTAAKPVGLGSRFYRVIQAPGL